MGKLHTVYIMFYGDMVKGTIRVKQPRSSSLHIDSMEACIAQKLVILVMVMLAIYSPFKKHQNIKSCQSWVVGGGYILPMATEP